MIIAQVKQMTLRMMTGKRTEPELCALCRVFFLQHIDQNESAQIDRIQIFRVNFFSTFLLSSKCCFFSLYILFFFLHSCQVAICYCELRHLSIINFASIIIISMDIRNY